MIAENLLNFILRYAVGVKLLFFKDALIQETIIPALFAFFWFVILILSIQKNGDYGAPQSLFYM
jgi:hypothetical protein